MKTTIATVATIEAMMPARIESAPRLGPTVRSSTMVSLAGSAPARSRIARSLALSTVKLPLIWPEPPRIGSRIDRRRDHLVVEHDGEGPADIGFAVTSPNLRRRPVDRRKLTTGSLVCWSKAACASTRSSPVISGTSCDDVVTGGRRRPDATTMVPGFGGWSARADGNRALDEVEGELRRLADDRLQPRRIAEARRLDEDAIVALALDARLGGAEFVDAAADDLDRLVDDAADALRRARPANR